MTFKKIVIATLAWLVLCAAGYSQNVNVTLHLVDATSGDAVGFATVSLTPVGADKATKYTLSDGEGKASLEKVKAGKYTLKAEIMGYKTITREMELTKSEDLGQLKMELDTQVLDAAAVSAVGNPIVIKKDTVEYNASSFKTTDNDMLVDLLKKLPGIEVGEDGSITSNGETITKITIDGKTFFLDDPQLASNNLPAKIIEKVKVVKKKSEQAEFTGIDDGNDETVIDLSVKKGMMNGLFGNVMAGGGHDLPSKSKVDAPNDWRFQGAAMLGRFTDKSQISFIANGNNTNDRGFNDLSGSMMNSMMGGSGGGRGMGRGQGGWGSGNGISTTWMGGLNGAWDLLDDKMELSANYLYNQTDKVVLERSTKDTYLDESTTLTYDEDGLNEQKSWGHRFGMRLDHKFSENTSILIQPQVNFGGGNFLETSDFSTSRNGVQTNKGFSSSNGRNKNVTTNGFMLFRQRLGIPGRTLSFMGNWNFSNNVVEGFNQSGTTYFEGEGRTERVNQRYDRNARNRSLSGRLVYTEPLGRNLYLEGNYSLRWNYNTSNKDTYDSGLPEPEVFTLDDHAYNRVGETPNALYSNSIQNRSLAHSAGMNLAYQEGKTRAQLGVSVNPTITHNTTVDGGIEKTYDNKVVNWAPQAMLFHDFNDNANIRLFYRGRSSQPSTQQLMAVKDNSNPLSISFGNPTLEPYFDHGFRSEFGYTNKKTFFSLRANLDGSLVQNPIVSASWYDPFGVAYSLPVNGRTSGNVNLRMFLNSPIAKSNFSVSWMNRVSYSSSGSYVGSSTFKMDEYLDSEGNLDYEKFLSSKDDSENTKFSKSTVCNDFFTANVVRQLSITERVRFTYRIDNLEVTATARTRMSKPWYTITTANVNTTWNNQLGTTVNWTIGRTGIVFKSDFDYNWYAGYADMSRYTPEYVLNAEISKLLLKNTMTIALKAYDIFDQAKNISVTDASNYHQEVYNNTLGRYIILSLTWRFGNFGKAGRQMQERYGGRPGGPRGPMGMPMGGGRR